MKYNVLGYLIGEGVRNIFKNKKSTGASVMIMCATMLIFGLFFLIGENVNHIVKEVENGQGLSVFVKKEATDEQITEVGEKIKQLNYVAKVDYVSKEDGMNAMKQKLGDQALSGYVNKNPLPASYTVTLTDLTKIEELKEQINQIDNVDDIRVGTQTINTLISISNGIQVVSGIILILLLIISVFIIANTIKLTVHARRKEISIMKYVGATNRFIRGPFIIEGIIIGVISALISIVVLGFSYNFVTQEWLVPGLVSVNLGFTLLTFKDMFSLIITVYLGVGIGIGALGSAISMKKYLEV